MTTPDATPVLDFEDVSSVHLDEEAAAMVKSGSITLSYVVNPSARSLRIDGQCPRCAHSFSQTMPFGLPATSIRRAPRMPAPIAIWADFTCGCIFPHPQTPNGRIGCGASFTIALDLQRFSPTEADVAAEATDGSIDDAVRRSVLAAGYRLIDAESGPVPGTLLGVAIDAGTAYPEFQFSGPDSFEPAPAFVHASALLDAQNDPVGALSWWLTPNPWTGNSTPASLLGTDHEPQIRYAAAQLQNDSW